MIIWPTVLQVALSFCTFSCERTIDAGDRAIAVESHSLWSGVETACHEASSTIECGKLKLEVTADSIEMANGKTVAIPPAGKAGAAQVAAFSCTDCYT